MKREIKGRKIATLETLNKQAAQKKQLVNVEGSCTRAYPGSDTSSLGVILSYAPEMTKHWGPYKAFVAVITIVAILSMPFVRTETSCVVLIIVLAAILTPVLAKHKNIE